MLSKLSGVYIFTLDIRPYYAIRRGEFKFQPQNLVNYFSTLNVYYWYLCKILLKIL